MSNDGRDPEDFFRQARHDLAGPLEGMRVLELTTTWAGPRCGALLADYGAEVIKIETRDAPDVARRMPPWLGQVDPPESYIHASVNRNKRSATINLRVGAGRDVFLQLARRADVVLENLRPGTLDRWGCGYTAVQTVKSDIVFVSISGFGQFGPYRHRPGYDPQAQAMSGCMWMNAVGDDPPLKSPIFLADELAGLHGAMATLAALRHRDRTGEGQHVDVSLLDAMMASSTGNLTLAAQGHDTPRLGNTFIFAAPAAAYQCSDGWVYAGVLTDAHWGKLAELLGRPELSEHPDYATIPARVARRAELDAMLAEWCAGRTRDETVAAFDRVGIAIAAVLTPAEAVVDAHVRARGALERVPHPSGTNLVLDAAAPKMSRTPLHHRHAARTLGADTDAVLEEAGIDAARRDALRADNVI